MKQWVLPYFCAALALLAVGLPLKTRLDAPRFGAPAIVPAGKAFEVSFATSLPFVPWRAAAGALERQWGLRLEQGGRRILSHRQSGNQHWITLADPTPVAGALRLPVDGLEHWSEGAVPDRLVLVHVADFPSTGREAMLERFVDEMAVLKPHAVLASGDLAYDSSAEWYTFLVGQLRRLEVLGIPVIACPGNHERGGWARYLNTFGLNTTHRVNLGPFAILSLDSAHGRDRLTPSQFQWFQDQLDHLEGRVPLIQLHHPVFPPGPAIHGNGEKSGGPLFGYRDGLVKLCVERQVPIVLTGHWHQDAVFDATGRFRDDTADFPGTKFVVTTALGDALRRVTRWPLSYYGYRILVTEKGRLLRYTQDLPGQPSPTPIASTPSGTWLRGGRP
ncbi:MAG: metallophosphoesterase [Acidobacteria bacterium]|nr:metallophosphoesterase [Acidobacteriota bacterium]MBI3487818.1 metallophosphoesterase [Acidobacteriota bacterium]